MRKIKVEIGNVYCVIPDSMPSELLSLLKNVCSYKQKTYDPRSYSDKEISISLFNTLKRIFPSGLKDRVIDTIKVAGYKVQISDLRDKPDRSTQVIMDSLLQKSEEFGVALRDYQINGLLAGVENQSGLFDWCTGAGKSVMFLFLLLSYDTTSLILVNRKELMEQIASEIEEKTGRTVGTIGDGVWNPSKWTVGIVNTFSKHLNSSSLGQQSRARKYLEKVKMFVGDEVHHLGSDSWKQIAKACSRAPIRFGFSGTCFHPDSEDIFLVGYTGEIISQVKYKDLVPGYLANMNIYMPSVEAPEDLKSRMNWHETRKYAIRENENIMESGIKFLKSMYNKGLTCIYFAGDDVQYGRMIAGALVDSGVDPTHLKFMSGTEPTEVRRSVLSDFKQKKFQILGGTSIYDEGVDVPHVGAGANFGQGYSEIKAIQRLGRVLRKVKKPGDVDVDQTDIQLKYYWDPMNMANSITSKHSNFRQGIYENQEVFTILNRDYGKKNK
jgi:superfamily II DNA or RNA helicase